MERRSRNTLIIIIIIIPRNVRDEESSFGFSLKKTYISSVSSECRSHEPKT